MAQTKDDRVTVTLRCLPEHVDAIRAFAAELDDSVRQTSKAEQSAGSLVPSPVPRHQGLGELLYADRWALFLTGEYEQPVHLIAAENHYVLEGHDVAPIYPPWLHLQVAIGVVVLREREVLEQLLRGDQVALFPGKTAETFAARHHPDKGGHPKVYEFWLDQTRWADS